MKRLKKRMLSSALILAMLLSLTVIAFASDDADAPAVDVSNASIICELQPGIYAPGSPLDHFYKNLEPALETAFEGRLDFRLLPQDSIGDAELIEQCMMGICDMINIGDLSFDIISGKIGWAFLPMMYKDYDDVDARYFNGWVADELAAALEEMNLIKVGYSEAGFRQVCNNKHAIESLADFQGIKLRVAQVSYLVDFYKACGALPVALANSEVASGIEQGTLDGQDNYFTAFYNLGTLDMTPYITMLDYLYCANSVCVSKDFWNSLSPEDQDLFKGTCMEVSASDIEYAREFEQNLINECVEAGTIQVVIPSDEFKAELKEAAMTVWEKEAGKYDSDIMDRVFKEFGMK